MAVAPLVRNLLTRVGLGNILRQRSLKDRLRAKFNVAVAELEHHDKWQRSVIGIVTISGEEQHVEESLQQVLAEADVILGPLLVNHAVEII